MNQGDFVTEFDSHELYGKTLKEAGELLDKYVIPIFRRGRFERPEMEGTGFLIEQNSNIYFITASHVIDAIKASQSNFVIAIKTQMFSLSLAMCKRTIATKTEVADNQFDLAAILISPENDYYALCKKVTIPNSKVLKIIILDKLICRYYRGSHHQKIKQLSVLMVKTNISLVLYGHIRLISIWTAMLQNIIKFQDRLTLSIGLKK